MDIICEVDRFSHGLNQTIIEQFQGKLTPKKKRINESTEKASRIIQQV